MLDALLGKITSPSNFYPFVLKAIEYAKDNGGTTVGLCGYSGGELYHMVDIPLLAKIDDMQKVEDVHMIVAHMTMQRILKELNDKAES